MSRIVILGSSFAGLTAAERLHKELAPGHEITVISNSDHFVFIPSLPWVLIGARTPQQVSVALKDVLDPKGIEFLHTSAIAIDPEAQKVETAAGPVDYDYLVIATGAHTEFEAIPGLGPHGGHTHSVCNLAHAMEAAEAYNELLQNPGGVVVGAAQGASCFGAGYETLFNIDTHLRKLGIRDRVPLHWVSSEPYLGHFGLGGVGNGADMVAATMKERGIHVHVNVAIDKVTEDAVYLSDGTVIEQKFSMIIPPFRGIEAIMNSEGVGNARGFIPVNDEYRHTKYPNIFAAGVTVAMAPPEATPIPTGVPKTGYMAEEMAKVVAHNIAADIAKQPARSLSMDKLKALCLLDAGNGGIFMAVEPIFGANRKATLKQGAWVHLAKIAFEKFFLYQVGGIRAALGRAARTEPAVESN